jgi:hypothetical protein
VRSRILGREPKPDVSVGPYRLVRRLGGGGQGSVWEARGPGDEKVALKEFDKPTPRTRERIGRELQLCAEAQHDHLVRVFDVVEARGRFWVAMNLAEGGDLSRRVVDRGAVTDRYEFALVMIQVACALAKLHGPLTVSPNYDEGGYAHRDVKPLNILSSGRGLRTHATLVDLSLVTSLDGKTTSPMATVHYAAPEQLQGRKPNDRVDVYSLAATGFFLLTGRPPHQVEGPPAEVLPQILALMERGAPALSKYAEADWAGEYDELFAEALSIDPNRRPSALRFAKRILAVTWPAGAPYGIVRIPAELEPAVLEATALLPADPSDPFRPQPRLVAATARAGRGASSLVRQARLIERASGPEAARSAYEEAARRGDASACAWLAQQEESLHGLDAARELWRAADEAGSAIGARRAGQIALADGDVALAAEEFRRAVKRRDPVAAFELHRLLEAHAELAAYEQEARRVFDLAVELHHPVASRIAGFQAQRRGEIHLAEQLYAKADQGGDGEAATRLAGLYARRGDAELAEEAYQRGIDRGYDPALMARARHIAKAAPAEQVEQLFRAAHRAGVPGSDHALARWIVLSDPQAAYELLAAVESSDNVEVAITFAAAALQIDRPAEAVDALEPLDGPGQHRVLLSAAHLAAGKSEQAGDALDSAGTFECAAWILNLSEPALERFSDRPGADGAASGPFHFAELARHRAGLPEASDPGAAEVRELYRRGRDLGCATSAAWVAYLSYGQESELEELERAAEMGNPWSLARMGEILHAKDDVGGARSAFERAIAKGISETARHYGPRYLLACYLVADVGEKERLLREAEAGGSLHAASMLVQLIAAEKGWRDPEIEHILSRADLRGSAAAADKLGLLLGTVYGDSELSVSAHERAFRRAQVGTYAYNLGVALNALGEQEKAERHWVTAAELGDGAAGAALADTWVENGDVGKALAFARKELASAAEHNMVKLYLLGHVFARAGEPDEAEVCYRRSFENGFAWAALQYSYYVADAAAVDVVERGIALATDDTDPHWHLLTKRARLDRLLANRLAALPKAGRRLDA